MSFMTAPNCDSYFVYKSNKKFLIVFLAAFTFIFASIWWKNSSTCWQVNYAGWGRASHSLFIWAMVNHWSARIITSKFFCPLIALDEEQKWKTEMTIKIFIFVEYFQFLCCWPLINLNSWLTAPDFKLHFLLCNKHFP